MSSPAQTKATVKYIKERTRTFTFRCNKATDADIIARLSAKGNVTGYLKELIRKDASDD